jgi:hypothetical protein
MTDVPHGTLTPDTNSGIHVPLRWPKFATLAELLAQEITEDDVTGFAYDLQTQTLWYAASMSEWKCVHQARVQTEPVKLYVSTEGDDANDGLTALAPIATFERVNDLWSRLGDWAAPFEIQLEPGSYDYVNLEPRRQLCAEARLHINCPSEVIASGTLTAESDFSRIPIPASLVVAANQHQGCFIVITSGPAAGMRRLILKNTTTDYYIGRLAYAQLTIGTTFEIQRPQATLRFPSDVEGQGFASPFIGMGQGIHWGCVVLSGLRFELLDGAGLLNFQRCFAHMFGCEIAGATGLYVAKATVLAGQPQGATFVSEAASEITCLTTFNEADHGFVATDISQLKGWGLSMYENLDQYYGIDVFDQAVFAGSFVADYLACYATAVAGVYGAYVQGLDCSGQSLLYSTANVFSPTQTSYFGWYISQMAQMRFLTGYTDEGYEPFTVETDGGIYLKGGLLKVENGLPLVLSDYYLEVLHGGIAIFQAPLHIDSTPTSGGSAIYVGAGSQVILLGDYDLNGDDIGINCRKGGKAFVVQTPVGKVLGAGSEANALSVKAGAVFNASALTAADSFVANGDACIQRIPS